MSFQVKIILITSLTLMVVLFYLNTMVINYMEYMKEDILSRAYEKDKPIKRDFVETRFNEYVWNVLLWEFLLVLAMMLILYKVIVKMTKQERAYRDFLELLLLTVSHKFGNSLAVQKGNIEILKLRYDEKALDRLERNYEFLKEDFKNILAHIESFKNLSSTKEKINLNDLIKKYLEIYNNKVEYLLRGRDLFVYANRTSLENIIAPIFENASKYSDGKVSIKLTKTYLAVRNRISHIERGTGVGLKIAEKLAEKEGLKLIYRSKGDFFISLLKFK